MERTTHLHIKQTNDYKYYVIRFLEQPHERTDKIVCIPWMWIISHRTRDLNVVVSYPVENPLDTEKRVKEREKHSKEWELYNAVVIYATDSFEDAKHFTAERMTEVSYKQNQSSNMESGDDELSVRAEKTTHRPKRSANLKQKITRPLESSNNHDGPGTASKRSKLVELAEAFVCPNENQSSPAPSNSSMEPKIIASREFFTDFFSLLRDLHTTSARDASMMDTLRETLIQNAQTMKDVAKLNDGLRASLPITPTAATSKGTTAEVEKISDKNNKKLKKQDGKVVNNKRSRKPKIVLPPEYDKNDSRWTLKHRELKAGLVELMPNTRVYVNEVGFEYCKRNAEDYNSLARMLSAEIFTKNALSVCSFTGFRVSGYGRARPGLDELARKALLQFVQKYGKSKGWRRVKPTSIQNSVYIKMHSMRKKL